MQAGEIGYIVTGIKEPGIARVGDTVTTFARLLPAFPGYAEPVPLVFASIYPETQDEFDDLRSSLSKLKLSDSSLTFEEEASGALGHWVSLWVSWDASLGNCYGADCDVSLIKSLWLQRRPSPTK